MINRKLRMGMIGGGKGAFIGAIHRAAALMDNQIELVCGCFSSKPEVSLASGREYFLPDDRIYTSYQQMIEREAALPEERRMDFVSIVTPNQLHFGPAAMAMEHGFDVVLDKPITFSLEEALPAQGQGRTNRPYPCADPYLFRLSGRQRSARTFRPRRFRENPENIRRIYAGMALHARRTRPASNAGWRTDPSAPEKRGRWEISALMPCNWPNTSPGSDASLCADLLQSWKDACSTTTARHCSVSTEAPPACWSQPR